LFISITAIVHAIRANRIKLCTRNDEKSEQTRKFWQNHNIHQNHYSSMPQING